ncbi:MAG: S1C family serine protease [Thermoanaerobaculia bacterium]
MSMSSFSKPSCLALAFALAWAPSLAAQDLKELARKWRDSVVLLNVYEIGGRQIGAGTGFFIADHRLVTNWHVVEDAALVEAVLASEETVEVVGLLAKDEVSDLAILEVAGGPFPALSLANTGVEAGERIVVLGNPLGLTGSLSVGIVSAVRKDGLSDELTGASDAPLLQITAAISPGSSGSPVMNLDGKVLGVAVSQAVLGQNLNFAVPAPAVRKLLEEAGSGGLRKSYRSKPSFARGAFLRNIIISMVFFVALYLTFRYWK